MEFFMKEELKVIFNIIIMLPLIFYYGIVNIILNQLPQKYRQRKSISGQTILITGAGSGIGREIALKFSKLCQCLVLLDLNKDSLVETEKLLGGTAKVFLYRCDVADRNNVYEVAKTIKEQVGMIDILINNAGIVIGKDLLDLKDEEILKTINVNMLAHFWMLKAFLPDMMKSNKGHIVSIASMAGITGLPRLSDYCASKFGAIGLMESLYFELQSKHLDGVKMTTVCPNAVSTGLFDGVKSIGSSTLTPEFVAQKVLEGVLENKELVLIPNWHCYVLGFKLVMPTQVMRKFAKNIGMGDVMKNFRGRTKDATNGSKPHNKDI